MRCGYAAGMKSPFPGMDPWLELHWGDVHHRLVQYSCDLLGNRLPEDLRARVEERVLVQDQTIERTIVPDVLVSEIHPWSARSASGKESGVALIEPLVFDVSELPITEGYVEIRARGGKVITVIEFLSLSNKRSGTGRDKYLEKQAEVLRSDASLVEIDLLRSGPPLFALPTSQIPERHRRDYLACVSLGWKHNRRLLYPMSLRQRLPALPIPLRKDEPPVSLDLQVLIDQTYERGRYNDLDYSQELDPPLSAEESAWAQQVLKTAKRS